MMICQKCKGFTDYCAEVAPCENCRGTGITNTMILRGNLRSKKNSRMATGNLSHYEPSVADELVSLETQVMAAWRDRNGRLPRLMHPFLRVQMFLVNQAKDRDNIWTTILDVLKKGGVIVDDCVRWYNGRELMLPAMIISDIREERVEITFDQWMELPANFDARKARVKKAIATSGGSDGKAKIRTVSGLRARARRTRGLPVRP